MPPLARSAAVLSIRMENASSVLPSPWSIQATAWLLQEPRTKTADLLSSCSHQASIPRAQKPRECRRKWRRRSMWKSGGAIDLELRLGLAGNKETVTVSGAPPLVETQPSAVSEVLDERALTDLPVNGRRFTDLALLMPGVTQDPRGMTSSSNGDLAFGGVRGYQSSYLVDGADNNNGFFAQARGRYRAPYQFSNEVVQEFRVSSNSYGAELGRAGGGVVNVVTKSGTNHWHGTGFYFLRDSALNAQHPFVDFKPADRQHQFGGTFGGPLKRNKAFVFAGFDQHIFNIPTVVRFLDGSSVVTPKKGREPLEHGDYEDSDKDLVFAPLPSCRRSLEPIVPSY